MKIYNFKCETYTPFAPYWDYFVGEKISKLDYSDLKEEILRKEKEKEKSLVAVDEVNDTWQKIITNTRNKCFITLFR